MKTLVLFLLVMFFTGCEEFGYEPLDTIYRGRVVSSEAGIFEKQNTILLSDGRRTTFGSSLLIVGDSVEIKVRAFGKHLKIIK